MPPSNRQTIKGSSDVEYAFKESNLAHFLFTAPSGTINLKNQIEAQTIRIVGQRVGFTSSTSAAMNPLAYLQMAPIGPNQANSNLQISAIPLVFDSQRIDSFNEIQYSLTLSSRFPMSFRYQITDENGVLIPAADLAFVQILFNFELDRIK